MYLKHDIRYTNTKIDIYVQNTIKGDRNYETSRFFRTAKNG